MTSHTGTEQNNIDAFACNSDCTACLLYATFEETEDAFDTCPIGEDNDAYSVQCGAGYAAYQVITYHIKIIGAPNCTAGDAVKQEVFYTSYCMNRGCVAGENFMELWECFDSEPAPYTMWPSSYTAEYFGEDDSCSTRHTRVEYSQLCIQDPSFGVYYKYSCDDQTLSILSCPDATCNEASCIVYETEIESYDSPAAPECYPENTLDSYFRLHCYPLNPAYQVVKYYANDGSDTCLSENMMYETAVWSDYCHDATCVMGDDWLEVWECTPTLPTIGSSMTNPIVTWFYDDVRCSDGASFGAAYTSECIYDYTTGTYNTFTNTDTTVEEFSNCDSYCSYYSCWSSDTILSSDGSNYPYCYMDSNFDSLYFTIPKSTKNPGYQIIKYFPYSSDCSDQSTQMSMIVFYTEYCQVSGCVSGDDYMEDWSCSVSKPDYYSVWPDGILVKYFGTDPSCDLEPWYWEEFTTSCIYDDYDGDHYSFGCTSSGTLTRYYSYSSGCSPRYTDETLEYASSGSSGCYLGGITGNYYDVDCLRDNPANQLIKYYSKSSDPSCTGGELLRVYNGYTPNCIPYGCKIGASENEVWECIENRTDPYSFWPDAIVVTSFGDSSCDAEYETDYTAYSPECISDTYAGTHIEHQCSSTSLSKFTFYDDDTCRSTYGTSTTLYNIYYSCYYSGGKYRVLSCYPYNPGYQVIEYYTYLTDESNCTGGEKLYTHVEYSDYCRDSGCVYGTYWLEKWSCTQTKPIASDFWPLAIIENYYGSYYCEDTNLVWTRYFNPDCTWGELTQSGYYFYCNYEEGELYVEECESSDICLDTCYDYIQMATPSWQEDTNCWATYSGGYKYYSLTCTPSNPAYQIIKYYTYTDEENCITEDLVAVKVYWDENCNPQGCKFGNYNGADREYWECSSIQPDPYSYWPNAVIYTEYDSWGCSGTQLSWTAYNPGCFASGEFFDCNGDGYLRRYTCTSGSLCLHDCYDYTNVIPSTPYVYTDDCYYYYYNDYHHYTLSCAPYNPAYQVISYYTDSGTFGDSCTTGDLLQVQAYWSDYCMDRACRFDGYQTTTWQEYWECFDDVPDLGDYIDNAIQYEQYTAYDSLCQYEPTEMWALASDCCWDALDYQGYYFTCEEGAIMEYSCDWSCSDDYCYLYDDVITPTSSYDYLHDQTCFYPNSYPYYYYSARCFPKNPAYQVIRYYTHKRVEASCDDGELIQVEVFWSENCANRSCVDGDVFNEVWECVSTSPDPYSYWARAIVLKYYGADSECTSNVTKHWIAYSPECAYEELDNERLYFECDDHNAVLRMNRCSSATCKDSCEETTTIEQNSAYYQDYEHCYWSNSHRQFFTIQCGPYNPAYKVVEARTVSVNEFVPGELLYMTVEWMDYCVPKGAWISDWQYYQECLPEAPDPTAAFDGHAPIVLKYYWNFCNSSIDPSYWIAFSPDCVYDAHTLEESIYFECDDYEGSVWDNICDGEYCLSEGWCTSYEMLVHGNDDVVVGCFRDSSRINYYYEMDCGSTYDHMLWDTYSFYRDDTQCATTPFWRSGDMERFCHVYSAACNDEGQYGSSEIFSTRECVPKQNFTVMQGVAVFSYSSPKCEENTETTVNWLKATSCRKIEFFDSQYYAVECNGGYVTTKFDCQDYQCTDCKESATFPVSTCIDGKRYECGLLPPSSASTSSPIPISESPEQPPSSLVISSAFTSLPSAIVVAVGAALALVIA